MGFGDYPAEYNAKVHGPYDPARFYGKGKYKIIQNKSRKKKFSWFDYITFFFLFSNRKSVFFLIK